MAFLASEIGSDEIISFPEGMRAIAIIHAFLCSVGVLMTSVITLSIIKSKNKRAQHYIIVSLCIADLLYTLAYLVVSAKDGMLL